VVPQAPALCPDNEEIYYDAVAQAVMPQVNSGRVALVGDGAVSLSAAGASLKIVGALQPPVLRSLLPAPLAGRPTTLSRELQLAHRTSTAFTGPHLCDVSPCG
jgi:hypothetical protein